MLSGGGSELYKHMMGKMSSKFVVMTISKGGSVVRTMEEDGPVGEKSGSQVW